MYLHNRFKPETPRANYFCHATPVSPQFFTFTVQVPPSPSRLGPLCTTCKTPLMSTHKQDGMCDNNYQSRIIMRKSLLIWSVASPRSSCSQLSSQQCTLVQLATAATIWSYIGCKPVKQYNECRPSMTSFHIATRLEAGHETTPLKR